jgi:hypothetical protein
LLDAENLEGTPANFIQFDAVRFLSRQTKPLLIRDKQLGSAAPRKLSLPQDSALSAPRLETESQPVSYLVLASQIYIAIHQAFPESSRPDQLRHSWKSKLFDAQGQYFFWEPVNNDIPETELSQQKNRPPPPPD